MNKRCKRLISSTLAAAMLAGIFPASVSAVHTKELSPENAGEQQQLAQSAHIYINPEEYDIGLACGAMGEGGATCYCDPNAELTPHLENYTVTSSYMYPYIVPITADQTSADIYAKAQITMSDTVRTELMSGRTLDVANTKFLILMAFSENMTPVTEGTEFLFNSTFLMPDKEAMEDVDVTLDDTYDVTVNKAKDYRWKISGNLQSLKIPNQDPDKVDAPTTEGGFKFEKYLRDKNSYIKDVDYFGETDPTKPGTSWLSGNMAYDWQSVVSSSEARLYNVDIYAIPVKMNWEQIAKDRGLDDVNPNTKEAGEIYARENFAAEDWQHPMELTVAQGERPYEGVDFHVDFNDVTSEYFANSDIFPGWQNNLDSIDLFVPTDEDADWYGFVNAMPIAGMIVGNIYQYEDNGMTSKINAKCNSTIDAGTVLVQFAKAAPGTLKVTKRIEGVAQEDDALLPETVHVRVLDQNGNVARYMGEEKNGQPIEGDFAVEDWKYTDGAWETTIQIDNLIPQNEDYGWDYIYRVETTMLKEGGTSDIQGYDVVSDTKLEDEENLVLEDQMELTRREDGFISYTEKEEAAIPVVTITDVYKKANVSVTFDPGDHGDLTGHDADTPLTYDDITPDSKLDATTQPVPQVTEDTDWDFTGWLCTEGAADMVNQTFTASQIADMSFTVDTVFVAQYEEDDDNGGGGHHNPPKDDDDDDEPADEPEEDIPEEEVPLAETPWLNTVDHYAYIVGYPEDYVTGQPTEDESRWPIKPQANITRAEVATIFFRLLTDEARDQFWMTTNDFPDVAADAWYNNAISTMVNAGIIQGYEDGTFRPNDNITRAEFAAIASRFMSSGYDVEEDLFTDISGHWARENINDAAMTKWINGYPDGTFLPDNDITRAEAVTLVNNVLRRAPDADHMLDSMIKWPDNMDTSAWYYEAMQEATNSHDYDMFEGAEYETWTALEENRDWAALEQDWMNAHRGGGEVM